ncbi:MAG: hypothetical protein EOO90_01800 [Pedobacter sp.]|nr:MAG: hypothetical protein EOO90_01800 [Pedobacter sp.]
MDKKYLAFIIIILTCCFAKLQAQSSTAFEKARLTVADGLPQSYVSGLVQDRQGFIWIGTRDGLARYDGRSFKVFRSKSGNTSSLSANVIANLFLDDEDQLWIRYQNGDIDILNTFTEHLLHFSRDPAYRSTLQGIKIVNGIIQTGPSQYWLLGEKDGLFAVDLKQKRVSFHSNASLKLAGNRITGAKRNDNGKIDLVTNSALVSIGVDRKIKQIIPYRFKDPQLFNEKRSWKDNSPIIRKNGDRIIIDEDRLIIFHSASNTFTVKPLPKMKLYVPSFNVFDRKGNLLFSFDGLIYILTPDNKLSLWRDRGPFPRESIVSMLHDRSGVLWIGTNGYDLRSIDLRLPRMLLQPYKSSFTDDILQHHLGVDSTLLSKSTLGKINPYLFRWAQNKVGAIWMTNAGPDQISQPNICSYQHGQLDTKPWQYTDTNTAQHTRISSLAFNESGQLYGLDFFLRLHKLDTQNRTVSILQHIKAPALDKRQMVNSMAIEGDHIFWITTTRGLLRYDTRKKATITFEKKLSVIDLTVLVNDPTDKNTLWIGSLGGGLIKFNKKTFKYKVFTTEDGLPNNTIYGIIPVNGALWCSSNKGIFTFDLANRQVRSYTALDGLTADEFNQAHFMKLPNNLLAFGGTKGYTVFNPYNLGHDDFMPKVALTGLQINNENTDYGTPDSLLSVGLNALDKLELNYKQNFLSFEFAAFQYNIPQKLRYRYRMVGVDNKWVETSTGTAVYTALSPGRYTFQVNATNTAGDWSKHTKELLVVIAPPFWQTWWFFAILFVLISAIIYQSIRLRIKHVRKQEQQKLRFEREVMVLETQALRAQMNPHFIFNCLNSIKVLIQESRNPEAVQYLTLFAKLVRSKIGNVQQEISLADELQTCKMYVQLESIRFDKEVDCEFIIDDEVDIHDVSIPPLLLQPLIENAIWHGILPRKKGGKIVVKVELRGEDVYCIIDDNGIGRVKSAAGKSNFTSTHQSQGIELIANRLKLHNGNQSTENELEIVDKLDEDGNAQGTKVLVKLSLQNN